MHVLELNDIALLLGNGDAEPCRAPGYAVLGRDTVVTGDAALAQARLNPRQTLNRFWLRLGTEPLHNARAHARHHADLAWSQLQQLASAAGNPQELILAVPGSFSREQLAVLLGIAGRCSFRAAGLVDSALAAASGTGFAGDALHVELQLHQCVLTRLARDGTALVREQVHALPGTGLVQLQERWAQRANGCFIQQSRFDPMHAAATEQQLYDRLPHWLAALEHDDDAHAELRNGSASYHAKLRAADMLEAAQPLYAQIVDAVQRERRGATLLFGAHFARLPRIARLLPGALQLAEDAAIRACLRHAALIRCEDSALRFVTRLPAAPATVPPAPQEPRAQLPRTSPDIAPTHLVHGARALRLEPGSLYLRADAAGCTLERVMPARFACTFTWDGAQWWLMPAPGQSVLLDGKPARSAATVQAGQRIILPEHGSELWLVAEASIAEHGA